MNFETWYKHFRNDPTADYTREPNSGELRIGWNACKMEVEKLLESHEYFNTTYIDGVGFRKDFDKL